MKNQVWVKRARLPLLSVSAFVMFTFAFAQADLRQQVLACTTIDGMSQRLACYDALAVSISPSELGKSDHWLVETDTNPIDDSKSVYFWSEALEGKNSYGDAPSLMLRCKSGEIVVYFVGRLSRLR